MDQKKPINIQKELEKGIWRLEKYGTYERNSWNEVADGSTIYLIFKNLCLTLVSNKTLVEHISVSHEHVRMVQKNDSLGIVVTKDGMKMKKLRVKFAGTCMYSGVSMALNCVTMLKSYVKIESVPTMSMDSKDSLRSNPGTSLGTIPLSQHISELLSANITNFYEDNKDLNNLFPLEDIVEACILDTDFPSIVATVHKILQNKLK